MKSLRLIFSIIILSLLNTADAQQCIVLSADDSSAIEGAELQSVSGSIRRSSDFKGQVSLKNLSDTQTITISHPLYLTTNIQVSGASKVYLKPRVKSFKTYVFTSAPGSKTPVKEELNKVQVIDAENIRETGSQNLADILKYETRITLQNDQVLGTSVSINGIGGQNVKILKNGTAVSGSMNGSIDISQINVSSAAQIEVIDGPMSLLYGSNSLGGSINVVGNRPDGKNKIRLYQFTESSGTFNQLASLNHKHGKLGIVANAGRNFFDGWSPGNKMFFAKTNTYADTSRYSLWKPRRQVIGDISLYFQLNKQTELKLYNDFLHEKILNRGMPILPYHETALDDEYRTRRTIHSLELNHITAQLKHNVLMSYSFFHRIKNTFYKDLTSMEESTLTGPENQDTTGIQTAQIRYISEIRTWKKFKAHIGADYHYEVFTGKRVGESVRDISSISAIGILTWRPGKNHILKSGFRQTLHSQNKIPLIPSFSYLFVPHKNTQIRLNAGKGFRTPGIKELYLYFVDINHNIIGNPNLKSESSTNLSAALDYQTKTNKSILFNVSINSFYNSFENLISLALAEGTEYTYVNIGKASNKGVNTDFRLKTGPFEALVKFSYIGNSGTLNLQSGTKYLNSLNRMVQLGYTPDYIPNFKLSVFNNHFGKAPSVIIIDEEPVISESEAYNMMDITMSYDLKIKKNTIQAVLGIKNIFDVSNIRTGLITNSAHQSDAGQRFISTGRNLFLSLAYVL